MERRGANLGARGATHAREHDKTTKRHDTSTQRQKETTTHSMVGPEEITRSNHTCARPRAQELRLFREWATQGMRNSRNEYECYNDKTPEKSTTPTSYGGVEQDEDDTPKARMAKHAPLATSTR